MKRIVFGLLLLGALPCGHAINIDLTPRFITTQVDGIVINRPYFADGNTKYAITLDRETLLSAASKGALFRFQKFVGAEFEIRYSSFEPEQGFDSANLQAYRAAALACASPGAENVTMEEEIDDPLSINGWKSRRFVYSYDLQGALVRESVTFLNIDPKQQLVLRTSAHKKDFAEADVRAAQIMNSWHEVLPGDERSGS